VTPPSERVGRAGQQQRRGCRNFLPMEIPERVAELILAEARASDE